VQARDIEAKSFPIGRRGYEKGAVDAFLAEVANEFRTLEEQAGSAPPSAPGAPTFENLGSLVTTILATAAAAADEMKAAAEKEIEATRRALAEELDNADQMRGAAQEEAAAILTAAREEAERIQQEALQHAAAVDQEANERATALERTTVANLEAMLADGAKQYERLRDVREQTADRLASVEAMIRKAREECSDEVARGAFKAARKAVEAAKPDNGAAGTRTAPDGQKATKVAAGRRAATATATARTSRPSRPRQG
jgi:DivIVA domain-containing protein